MRHPTHVDESGMATRSAVSERSSMWNGTDYGWWLSADTAGTLAAGIADFALPLITLSTTHSPELATLTETLLIGTQTILSIPGGVIQDRYDRKKLTILWGLCGALLFGGIAVLDGAGTLTWPLIIVMTLLLGVRAGLLGGASNAMLRGLVPDESLPKALSLNSARDATVTLIGGPISSLLMTATRCLPMVLGALLNMIGACCATRITRYWHRNDSDATHAGAFDDSQSAAPRFRDAFSGLAWMLTDRFQRRLILSASIAAGAGNAFLLITTVDIAADDAHLVSAGFINAMAAAGMLVGSLIATLLIERVPSGTLIIGAFAIMGTGFVCAALMPSPLAKAPFVMLSLIMLPAGSAAIGGLTNVLVGEDKLGRVGAASSLMQYGAYAALSAIAGWALSHWGYTPTCMTLAILVAIGAAAILTSRALTTMPTPRDWGTHIEHWHLSRF